MCHRDKIIMTYMKLKHNISYSLMSIIFQCYEGRNISNIFNEMIVLLSKALKPAIRWPSKQEISHNLPECFEGFENVRVILDCTEIFIQTPDDYCCQLQAYTYYKGDTTIKIMIGITPAGSCSYVSPAYGGRASDTEVFKQSNLINLLEPDDAIMVDRGYLIDEICAANRWSFIRPPLLENKKQFSHEESVASAKIAAARVHIERFNQKLKVFKVLGSKLPANHRNLADKIITVLCATVNLSSPIIADKNFMFMK